MPSTDYLALIRSGLGPAARPLLPLGVEVAVLGAYGAVLLMLARAALAHLENLSKREGRLTQRWQ